MRIIRETNKSFTVIRRQTFLEIRSQVFFKRKTGVLANADIIWRTPLKFFKNLHMLAIVVHFSSFSRRWMAFVLPTISDTTNCDIFKTKERLLILYYWSFQDLTGFETSLKRLLNINTFLAFISLPGFIQACPSSSLLELESRFLYYM